MKLKDKMQHALDESRMLILGIEVLLGFDLQAFVMSGYGSLSAGARLMMLASLALLLVATALVFLPVARHRIVDSGRDTPHLHVFTRRVTAIALAPFTLGLGANFYVVGARVQGEALGLGLAASVTAACLIGWYVVPRTLRRQHPSEDQMEEIGLSDKIRQVLTEARVVLPGTQALLGFQFAATLQSGFDALPATSKLIHVVALCFLGASVVFLMLPAAYHRIAEGGENSEALHRISSVSILLAMATLAIAIAGDTFIVVRRATGSLTVAACAAGSWLVLAYFGWFGLMLIICARRASAARERNEQKRQGQAPGGPIAFERG